MRSLLIPHVLPIILIHVTFSAILKNLLDLLRFKSQIFYFFAPAGWLTRWYSSLEFERCTVHILVRTLAIHTVVSLGIPGKIPKLCLRLAFTNSLFNKHPINPHYTGWFRRKITILVRDSTCYGKKNVNMNKYLRPNGYRHRTVWIWRVLLVTCLFVGLDDDRTLQKECGYTRRIACSHSGCYCPHKRNVKINTGEQLAIFTHTRDAKCTEADGGISAPFIVTCSKSVISV